jgi:hypothetical protein
MKPCPFCRNGERPCPTCRAGTAEFPCPECSGRGYEYDVDGNAEGCERCHGDGYLPPDACASCVNGFVDCQACDGTGELEDGAEPLAPNVDDDNDDDDDNDNDNDNDDEDVN